MVHIHVWEICDGFEQWDSDNLCCETINVTDMLAPLKLLTKEGVVASNKMHC